jgi:hypothetical protein
MKLVERRFRTQFEEYRYKYYATLKHTVELLACESDEAPEYNRGSSTFLKLQVY